MIKTVCKLCKFAEFQDNKQVGCRHNRIEKFQKYEVPVNLITEENKTFYEIEDICTYCFNKDSYNKTENAETKFYNITRFNCDTIVIDNKNEDFMKTYNKLLSSIHSAIYEEIRPNKFIYVITSNPHLTPENRYQLFDLVNDMLKGTSIKSSVSFMLSETVDFYDCLKSVFNKVESRYFSLFESGYQTTYDFNSKLNKELNENLRYFSLFNGFDDKNGVVISSDVYRELGAYTNNIKEYIKEQLSWMEPKVRYRYIIESFNDEYPS